MNETVVNVVVEHVSLEKLNEMQSASDKLVESLYSLIPPRGEMCVDHYDSSCQHTILGNAMIRLLISISDKMGALDLHALRSASYQALAYIAHISEPVASGTVENTN